MNYWIYIYIKKNILLAYELHDEQKKSNLKPKKTQKNYNKKIKFFSDLQKKNFLKRFNSQSYQISP